MYWVYAAETQTLHQGSGVRYQRRAPDAHRTGLMRRVWGVPFPATQLGNPIQYVRHVASFRSSRGLGASDSLGIRRGH